METPTLSAWNLAPIQAFFAFTQTTFSEENKIPLVKVSEAAIYTAEKGAPGIILLEAKIENENATVVYEFEVSEAGEFSELQENKKGEKDFGWIVQSATAEFGTAQTSLR